MWILANMMKAAHLADALGRKRMADAIGVGLTAVSNAVVRNTFPASWFIVCKSLAEESGIECPPDLFSFVDGRVTQ